ncbi:MAG TPA: hypothetical protein VIK89_14665, partial [Cytophagaceae bacterium]
VNIIEDSDGFYTFVYKDTASSPKAEDLFKVPNQSYHLGLGFPLEKTIGFAEGKSIEGDYTGNFNFDLNNNAALKYIDLKAGYLLVDLSSNFRHDARLQVTFHSLIKNGAPLQQTIDFDYNNSIPVHTQRTIDLTGYRIELSNGDTTTNFFDYTATLTLVSSGQPISISDSLMIDLKMQNLKYSLLYGNPGVFPIDPATGSVTIDVFDKTVISNLYFEEPKVKITFDNSFGIPASVTINKLETETVDGNKTPFTSSALNDPITLNYPLATETGQSKTTELLLDKNNSDIQTLLSPGPHKVNYTITTQLGSSATADKFITDESRINVYVEVEIPIYGTISIYALQDTFNIGLPEREYVERALMKLKTENELPIDVYLQVYFLDNTNTIIDSLLVQDDNVIVSGVVDNTGKVIAPASKLSEVELNKIKYDRIADTERMIVRGSLITTNNTEKSVKIYSHYKLNVQISLLADAKINFQ